MKFSVNDFVEWDFSFGMTKILEMPRQYGKGPFQVKEVISVFHTKGVGADCWIIINGIDKQLSGAFFKKLKKYHGKLIELGDEKFEKHGRLIELGNE